MFLKFEDQSFWHKIANPITPVLNQQLESSFVCGYLAKLSFLTILHIPFYAISSILIEYPWSKS